MANLPCPIERIADEVRSILRSVTRHAQADGHIDEVEHSNITRLHAVKRSAINASAQRKLARHIEQMDGVTDYTHRLARAADLDVIDLAAQRTRRSANVVEFPGREHAG